jgi:hypothetical protein
VSAGSPFLSITDDIHVVNYFSRCESQAHIRWITKFEVPSGNQSKAFARYNEFSEFNYKPNLHIGQIEREFLAPVKIDPRYATQQYLSGP